MADTVVRLGMALCVIALVSVCLYGLSGRAGAAQPMPFGLGDQR